MFKSEHGNVSPPKSSFSSLMRFSLSSARWLYPRAHCPGENRRLQPDRFPLCTPGYPSLDALHQFTLRPTMRIKPLFLLQVHFASALWATISMVSISSVTFLQRCKADCSKALFTLTQASRIGGWLPIRLSQSPIVVAWGGIFRNPIRCAVPHDPECDELHPGENCLHVASR